MPDAYLVLETGEVFKGESFGASGESFGELVFTTSMTGCAETLTDPSFFGQTTIYTFPMLGNYGINYADRESAKCHMSGVVVREYCERPSNFRCETDVSSFLKENGVVAIQGLDTRFLTQMIRDRGVMNACVTTGDPASVDMDALKKFKITGAVSATGIKEKLVVQPVGEKKFSVALIDYGTKKSIANYLAKRGCEVTILPHSVTASELLSSGFDGVMLSNGPGDPSENTSEIAEINKLMGNIPIFGICLGHQMLALAAGGKTTKMKFGHRGGNQPAKDVKTGRVYITSQNHGYAVDADSLAGTGGSVRFINVNDGTCEGVDYDEINAFSMQFHPEAHGGPRDSEYAFDRFVSMMTGRK